MAAPFFSQVRLHIVDGRRAGLGSISVLRESLPETSGIYVWTWRVDDALPGGSGRDRLQSMEKRTQERREKRPDAGRIGRYRRAQIFDESPPLTMASHGRLDQLHAGGITEINWVLLATSLFQRPLYVGKALNFRDRIPQHFKYRTRFSKDLNADGFDITDCVVALLSVVDPPDGSTLKPPGQTGDVTDLQIQLAESMVIRTAQPIYNVRMD